jgi:hypothetical protein
MAEVFDLINTGTVGYTASTTLSVFKTASKRNFAIYLTSATPDSGAGTDTFDGIIEECDDASFPAAKVHTVRLTTPSGTGGTAITQVLGNSSSASILRQKYNLLDSNFLRYIRLKPTVGGVGTVFKDLRVSISYDLITRTTL